MKIPKKIKLSNYIYTVNEVDEVVVGTSTNHWGSHSQADFSVDIRKDFPSDHIRLQTLIHELLHGIFDCAYMYKHGKWDSELEELYVSHAADGIVNLLKDNPKLRQYMMEVLDA